MLKVHYARQNTFWSAHAAKQQGAHYAVKRFLKWCILLGFAFRVRTDPYLVARRSSGTFREVIVGYLEATQVQGFPFFGMYLWRRLGSES